MCSQPEVGGGEGWGMCVCVCLRREERGDRGREMGREETKE